MSENARTALEWRYTPSNFFEEPVQIDTATGSVIVENGLARGIFAELEYARGADFIDEMHKRLRQEFISQQVLTRQFFKLPKPKLTLEHNDGRIDTEVVLLFRTGLRLS